MTLLLVDLSTPQRPSSSDRRRSPNPRRPNAAGAPVTGL